MNHRASCPEKKRIPPELLTCRQEGKMNPKKSTRISGPTKCRNLYDPRIALMTDANVSLSSKKPFALNSPSLPSKGRKKTLRKSLVCETEPSPSKVIGTRKPKPEQWKEIALSLQKENFELKETKQKYETTINTLETKLKAIYGNTPRNNKLHKELDAFKKENENLKNERKRQNAVIKNLNQKLSKYKNELENCPEKSVDYYKRLSVTQLKESSSLAEQLICLRSDLETQNLQLLKTKKDSTFYFTETWETPFPVRQAFTEEPDEEIPQPQKSRPRPMVLSPTNKVNGKGVKAPSLLATVIETKLDPPKTPYNFTYRPHPFSSASAKKEAR